MKALTLALTALFATASISVAKPAAPRQPQGQEEPPPGAYLVIIAASHGGGANTGVAISYLPYDSMTKCEAATKSVHTGGVDSIYTAESFCVPQ